MCVLVQIWIGGDGLFTNATKWKSNKVPKMNAAVVVAGEKGAEVTVKEPYVHSRGTIDEISILRSVVLQAYRILR